MTSEQTGLLPRIIAWAGRQADIAALIMTGFRARRDTTVDDFSDYDLEIFTTDPGKYTSHPDWLADIGTVWVFLPLPPSHGGCPTRLVVFSGGEKVDFSICPIQALEDAVRSQKLNDLYERGYQVLLDKRGIASGLPAPTYSRPSRSRPTEAEFRATIEEFWFEESHIPKYLRRDDLWVVKFRDWTMKGLLLRMLDWHAVATNEEPLDTWHIGTRMREWLRWDVWANVQTTLGRFDAADSWRALLATISVFRAVQLRRRRGWATNILGMSMTRSAATCKSSTGSFRLRSQLELNSTPKVVS